VVEQQVLLRMCAKLVLGGGPQGIANLQQGFLQNILPFLDKTISTKLHKQKKHYEKKKVRFQILWLDVVSWILLWSKASSSFNSLLPPTKLVPLSQTTSLGTPHCDVIQKNAFRNESVSRLYANSRCKALVSRQVNRHRYLLACLSSPLFGHERSTKVNRYVAECSKGLPCG